MTREEILQIARKAGALIEIAQEKDLLWLETFAHLVEDKVTARYMQLFLDPENQPTQFGTATQEYREKEIKNEREACAKLFDNRDNGIGFYEPHEPAEIIRARGQA